MVLVSISDDGRGDDGRGDDGHGHGDDGHGDGDDDGARGRTLHYRRLYVASQV